MFFSQIPEVSIFFKLQYRSYQSAEQDDLWRFLTETARANKIFDDSLSVKEIMDTWTLQTGFPVIRIERHYDDESFKITQVRCLSL